jgi:hypothetical protein
MSAMDFQELISRFGLALGIGLLFGLAANSVTFRHSTVVNRA